MPLLLSTEGDPAETAARLEAAWRQGHLVGLCAPQERDPLSLALGTGLDGFGPGVVVGSGGSSGGRRWCVQPLAHLVASARATGRWLEAIGLEPARCLHLDPLPLHHVSGLLPLLRARLWGGPLQVLPPALLRRPEDLVAKVPLSAERPALLSLVPTQLARLLASPAATDWLRGCALIWVGGAALPPDLAVRARAAGIRLSPCYGATETAAMAAALPPAAFLAGAAGCGAALPDVELRCAAADGAIAVRTERLSPGWLAADGSGLRPFAVEAGWWRSGDAGRLGPAGLEVIGRLDGAISCGGETVFPEQVEELLRGWARQQDLPLGALLLLPLADPLWGERLAALVRPEQPGDASRLLGLLSELAVRLPPPQRPLRWHHCPELAPSASGKWERPRWREWLERTAAPGL